MSTSHGLVEEVFYSQPYHSGALQISIGAESDVEVGNGALERHAGAPAPSNCEDIGFWSLTKCFRILRSGPRVLNITQGLFISWGGARPLPDERDRLRNMMSRDKDAQRVVSQIPRAIGPCKERYCKVSFFAVPTRVPSSACKDVSHG